MTTLVFFLEELSAKALLESLLPRILPDGYDTKYVVFEGKSDLEKRLVMKLRAWQKPDCKFIVLRDQDTTDCLVVKSTLRLKCIEGQHPETLVRIACRELESWYLGDLTAVEKGFGIPRLANLRKRAKYRAPDLIGNPAEELRRLTKKQYQKVSGSRAIGAYLNPSKNCSHSFGVFMNGLEGIWRVRT